MRAFFCKKGNHMTDHEELYRKALAFTGSTETAEEIALSAADQPDPLHYVTEASVRFLRQQNPELFTKGIEYVKGDEEFSAADPETDTAGLDADERIVVLLAAYENMTDEQSAAYLGVSVEYVKALRQSAQKHKHPKKKSQLPVPAEKRNQVAKRVEENEKEKKEKKLPFNVQIWASLLIAALLGGFFGIRSYATSQYESGLNYLVAKNYEKAAEALNTARRYGCKEPELLLNLGTAYYSMEKYEEALPCLEKYFGSQTDLDPMQLECYEKVWSDSLAAGDYVKAADMMRREYQYSRSPYSLFRQMAAENRGTFQDEKGNVYNLYGMPEKVVVRDPSDVEVYTVELKYDENHDLINAGSLGAVERKPHAEYSFEFHPDAAYSTVTEQDSHGYPQKKTVINQDGTEEITYENTYEKGLLKEVKYSSDGGKTSLTDEYVYADGRLDYIRHGDSVTSFGYDSEGRVEKEITRQGTTDTEMIRYAYDDAGNLISRSVYSTGETETFDNAPDGVPFTSTVTSADGTVVRKGMYIRNTGWVYFCYE